MASKDEFIHQLAIFLVEKQAQMSVMLELGKGEAMRWRDLRQTTPLFGYPTVEEAEEILKEFLK